jgi:polyisoprenoid-binding protein YceI
MTVFDEPNRVARRRIPSAFGLTLAVLLLGAWPSAATTYKVDPEHTSVIFRVRHLFTTVTGRFERFSGKIVFDETGPEKTVVEGSIDAASVNTNVKKRDDDLRSKRFFEVATYPEITFRSSGVTDVRPGSKKAKMSGVLSMHGVERPIVLDVEFLGKGKDPWGNERAGFRAATTINRKDWGLNWNEVLEAGGFLVGDEVTIEVDAEALAQDDPGQGG